MADRQQQPALAGQHVLQAGGHGIDLRRQRAQLVVPALRDGVRKIAAAIAQGAGLDVAQRPQQVAHPGIGAGCQRQQRSQRGPAKPAWPVLPAGAAPVQPEADVVAVGGAALQRTAPLRIFWAVVRIRMRSVRVVVRSP